MSAHFAASFDIYLNQGGSIRPMQYFSRYGTSIFAISLLLWAAGLNQLQAQAGGTLSGTIFDQAGKPIPAASVDIRNELTAASRTVTADNDGRFSATDLTPGAYSVVVAAPGFALATRSGGQVLAGATLDIPITMSVEGVATQITVNESISIAAASAPSGNTLEAVSAKTEVSSEFRSEER